MPNLKKGIANKKGGVYLTKEESMANKKRDINNSSFF